MWSRSLDLTEISFIERELMLIKVRAAGKDRDEMKRMADIFRGRIIDVTDKTYTVELTGDSAKLDGFIAALDEAVHSGNCPDRQLRHRTRRTRAQNIRQGCDDNESFLRQRL